MRSLVKGSLWFTLAVLVIIMGLTLLSWQIRNSSRARENPAALIVQDLQLYLPDNPAPVCELSYYGVEYSACVLFDVPGYDQVSLTVQQNTGKIIALAVVLKNPISVGDLELEFGNGELTRKPAWQWVWDDEVYAYHYSDYGRPSLFTKVRMLAWR